MPPVGAAIAAAVAEYAASITIGSILSSIATSLVLSGLQRLITGKPKSQGGQSAFQNRGITQQVRQPIMTRQPVYGEIRKSGGLLYLTTTSNNRYLHMIIEIAPHAVAEIGEVWLNGYSIPTDHIDSNGNVTQGRYANLVRIKKHLGSTTQTADSDLVAEATEWTTAHRLRGIAYVYVRMDRDQDTFPTGVPNISAWVRGKEVYDPRTTSTAYNNNIALILNDYLEDSAFGLGASTTEIEQTFLTSATNTCDEFVTTGNYAISVLTVENDGDSPLVFSGIFEINQATLFFQRGDKVQATTTGTLPGGLALSTDYYVIPHQRVEVAGTKSRIKLASSYANALSGTAITITSAGSGTHTFTKIAEPRYTGALVIDTEIAVKDNIQDILSGMSGMISYSGGVYRIFSGSYQTPTVYFDENDLASAVSVQTKVSKRERFNSVRGVYTSPINNGEPSDYPEITNSTYVTEDTEKIVKQIDMPATQRTHTAQRIAKINLELSRQEITFNALFNLSALQVVAGDNVYISISDLGWSNKVFQVQSWAWSPKEKDGVVLPLIRMVLREIASANYDWNSGEETLTDPAPNSILPDVFTVNPPTGLAISAIEVPTADGDLTYEFLATFTASTSYFVIDGGHYQVEFKKTSETEWLRSFMANGEDTSITVKQVQPGINYDLRIRAVNSLGVRSTYQQLLGFTISSPSGATIRIDYGQITGTVVDTVDYGTITDAVASTNDFGSIT